MAEVTEEQWKALGRLHRAEERVAQLEEGLTQALTLLGSLSAVNPERVSELRDYLTGEAR